MELVVLGKYSAKTSRGLWSLNCGYFYFTRMSMLWKLKN